MKAFYAGSFDPFTIGHKWIVETALKMFDEVIIGIGFNESKHSETGPQVRLNEIKAIFENEDRVRVLSYSGITAEEARRQDCAVLLRGVRNSFDFEKEKELADTNLEVFGMPTVLIPAKPSLSFVSSSMVRELSHFGVDASEFVAK